MKVIITPWIKEFVEKTPQISRRNACGWLVGFKSSQDQLVVVSVIAASKYLDTDYSYRIPDPEEMEEVMQLIPSHLKVLGIYHFKPGAQLKITSKAGVPEKFYESYPNQVLCITNTETTKFYKVAGLEYSELETYYHELPENFSKSLIIFAKINLATEINLKISYLPQVENDILEDLDSLSSLNVALRKDPAISAFNNTSKPFLTRDITTNLLSESTVLKDDETLVSLLKSNFSSITSSDTYLSVDLTINKITNEEEIQKRDKFSKYIGMYSTFVVPCVVLLNLQHPQTPEEILSTVKEQLTREIKYKIPRSMIKYSHNRNGLLVLPPESHLLQYKGVILNIKAHIKKVDIVKKQFELELVENLLYLSYFSQTHLPEIEESFFREDGKLVLFRQKFSTLGKLIDKPLAIGLLQALGYIYKERGQIQSVTEVQRLASSF